MKNKIHPDPSWKELYKAGGISALLYVAIAIILPAVMYMIHPIMSEMESGKEVLRLISSKNLLAYSSDNCSGHQLFGYYCICGVI